MHALIAGMDIPQEVTMTHHPPIIASNLLSPKIILSPVSDGLPPDPVLPTLSLPCPALTPVTRHRMLPTGSLLARCVVPCLWVIMIKLQKLIILLIIYFFFLFFFNCFQIVIQFGTEIPFFQRLPGVLLQSFLVTLYSSTRK